MRGWGPPPPDGHGWQLRTDFADAKPTGQILWHTVVFRIRELKNYLVVDTLLDY